jgi:deoxyribodipyrimidine photo-lyase
MIEESRIRPLNKNRPKKGEFVLYWMQASQRAEHNHALEFAIEQANELKLPVIVYSTLLLLRNGRWNSAYITP